MNGEDYFRGLWDGKRQSTADRLFFIFLLLLSFPYSVALRLRAFCYRTGIFCSHALDRPVISVGNLTVGGTGKTPTVIMLAKYLMAKGKRVAVLSRGYRSASEGAVRIVSDGVSVLLTPEEAGDEPYLMASTLPGLMVVTGADRYSAGLLAQERLNPDIFIMDDGYQHLRLRRDLNILLLDSARPLGNGRTLPAGQLREPETAINRAEVVIYTRCTGSTTPLLAPEIPSCRASHVLTGAVRQGSGELLPLNSLSGMRCLAFAGIADPAGFFDSLEREGLMIVATLAFPDHAGYGEEEIAALCRLRDASRSAYLVTTEKDAVKLAPWLSQLGDVYAVRLEIRLADMTPLEKALEKVL